MVSDDAAAVTHHPSLTTHHACSVALQSCRSSRAGSISALLGASSFGAGAIVSTIAGLFHDGTARPLAVTVLVVLIGSTAALYALTFRPAPADRPPAPPR